FAGPFVANDAARGSLNVRKQVIHRLHLALLAACRKLRTGTLDQVVEISLRMLQGIAVSLLYFAPNKQVGVETIFECKDVDREFLFHQNTQGALSGSGAGSIRVEIHNHVLAEAAEQPGLRVGERCSRT